MPFNNLTPTQIEERITNQWIARVFMELANATPEALRQAIDDDQPGALHYTLRHFAKGCPDMVNQAIIKMSPNINTTNMRRTISEAFGTDTVGASVLAAYKKARLVSFFEEGHGDSLKPTALFADTSSGNTKLIVVDKNGAHGLSLCTAATALEAAWKNTPWTKREGIHALFLGAIAYLERTIANSVQEDYRSLTAVRLSDGQGVRIPEVLVFDGEPGGAIKIVHYKGEAFRANKIQLDDERTYMDSSDVIRMFSANSLDQVATADKDTTDMLIMVVCLIREQRLQASIGYVSQKEIEEAVKNLQAEVQESENGRTVRISGKILAIKPRKLLVTHASYCPPDIEGGTVIYEGPEILTHEEQDDEDVTDLREEDEIPRSGPIVYN